MEYALKAVGNLNIDGANIAAGETIATLTTEFDPSNIFSACWFGDARPEAIRNEPTAAVTDVVKQVRRATVTAADVTAATVTVANVTGDEMDPDTLNALDAADGDTVTEGIAATTTKPGEPIRNPFNGLAPRIADALLAAGFESRDAVASVAAEGADAFLDYEGIGKSAAKKIIAWLGSE